VAINPCSAAIVPPAALINGCVSDTDSVAPYDDVVSVSSIVPAFVEGGGDRKAPDAVDAISCTRNVAPAGLVTEPLKALAPFNDQQALIEKR